MVLIVGASRGIGFSLAEQYKQRGEKVIATCRRPTQELLSMGVEISESVDVSSARSVRRLAQNMSGRIIDTLICNAGILTRETLEDLDMDRIRDQFEVNTLGPLRVVQALQGNLVRGSKVALISSRMGSLNDNTGGGMYGYRISKAGTNMVGVCLHRDLSKLGIAVSVIHPGYVRTDMTGGKGLLTAEASASHIIQRLDELDLSNAGQFLHANGERLSW